MLGRGVARELRWRRPETLVDPAIAEITRPADLFVLNLECCTSERGEPVPKSSPSVQQRRRHDAAPPRRRLRLRGREQGDPLRNARARSRAKFASYSQVDLGAALERGHVDPFVFGVRAVACRPQDDGRDARRG